MITHLTECISININSWKIVADNLQTFAFSYLNMFSHVFIYDLMTRIVFRVNEYFSSCVLCPNFLQVKLAGTSSVIVCKVVHVWYG